MIIHVVQPDETISSISSQYNISEERLIQDNGLSNPDNLVVGQTIVIVYPSQIYVVSNGDTLLSIAEKNNITIIELLRNNPHLSDREYLFPGETLIIQYEDERIREVPITGYAYPFIDRNILKKTLPFLTYLTVFNYRISLDGTLNEIDDTEIIALAKTFGVAPIMFISTLTEQGVGSSEIANNIIYNPEVQDRLINNTIDMIKKKGYYGVNIYLQHIGSENLTYVEEYMKKFHARTKSEGILFAITLTPRLNFERTSVSFEEIDYSVLSQNVDGVLLLSYEFGYSLSPPASVTPVNIVKDFLNFATKVIPPSKIFLGIPIIGYDWQLPYIPGASRANAITAEGAIRLASSQGVSIQYNEISQAPYFFYQTENGEFHIVWFKDARSIDAITDLVIEFDLLGMSIWNIMNFFQQLWLIINVKFKIIRVL